MEDNIVPGQRFAFVLRLWTEGGAENTGVQSTLRGSLQQVGSTHVRYFRVLEEIPALLREAMAARDEDAEP